MGKVQNRVRIHYALGSQGGATGRVAGPDSVKIVQNRVKSVSNLMPKHGVFRVDSSAGRGVPRQRSNSDPGFGQNVVKSVKMS